MYTLEKIRKSILSIGLATAIFATASSAAELKKNVDGSVIYPRVDGKYSSYNINKQDIKGFTYGRTPTAVEISAWDKDVMPDGTGLPEGQGTVEDGDELYHTQCATCHGDFGTGGKGYPTLVGGKGSLKNQLLKAGDLAPLRTIGSYWPYASTLFWYIQSAMPFPHPKSLSNDETYAITAYLLSVNDITIDGEDMEDEYILNKEKMLKIKMPNENGFYPVHPDRKDLKEQRVPLAQGTRCMKDCKTPAPLQIVNEIKGFDPAISTVRDLPKVGNTTEITPEQTIYETSCVTCHGNPAIGAPVLGDKEAWAKVTIKGLEQVYNNGINGINSMPPKGGDMDLTDDQMKEVINYMINSSK